MLVKQTILKLIKFWIKLACVILFMVITMHITYQNSDFKISLISGMIVCIIFYTIGIILADKEILLTTSISLASVCIASNIEIWKIVVLALLTIIFVRVIGTEKISLKISIPTFIIGLTLTNILISTMVIN